MKIGIDARLWNEGGVGRYIRNLIENLFIFDKDNEYVLFAFSKDHENIKNKISNIKNKWKMENVKSKIIKMDIMWHTIEEQIKFPQILNKENLDLVHFPYISVPIFYNRPFIVTIHDLIPYRFPTGYATTLPRPIYYLKRLGYKLVVSQAARKALKIIVVSNATKNEMIKYLKVDPNKIVVTYEGVGIEIRNSKFEIRNNVQNTKYKILNTKYFLYVGNAYPHKNLERLLEAFNILISQYPNISFILVGKDDYFHERLKTQVKKMGLEKSVKFLGYVNDEELVNLYRNALALVNPSLIEGFGLSNLEAMVNRCLVLASDIQAHREICQNAVLYFDPKDIVSIRDSMEEVLLNDSNHFTEKISIGFERAKWFSWEKMAKETLRIYESCVGL